MRDDDHEMQAGLRSPELPAALITAFTFSSVFLLVASLAYKTGEMTRLERESAR